MPTCSSAATSSDRGGRRRPSGCRTRRRTRTSETTATCANHALGRARMRLICAPPALSSKLCLLCAQIPSISAVCGLRPAKAGESICTWRSGRSTLAGERYRVQPELVPVRLDISRTTGDGTRCGCASRRRWPDRACAASSPPPRRSRSTRARSRNRPIRGATPRLAARQAAGRGRRLELALRRRTACSTCARGRATRSRSACRRTSCAARTAPACARCAAPT